MKDKYYDEIKSNLIEDEIYSKVKDYSKENHRALTYYKNGKLLKEAGKHYGDNIINKYSQKLIVEVGKKYTRSTLFRMKQFYNVFCEEKVAPLVRQLTWSHCLLLLPLKDINKIYYYATQVIKRNLSKRQLGEIIKSSEYERLPEDTKNKLNDKENSNVVDFVKNPILIKKNNNYEVFSEKLLQKMILENIPKFLEELGEGFTFIKNEYKIKIGNRYNYIDLLLYNIKYRCYVVVELKITELKKEHTGQIQTYMNYIDQNIKSIEDNKTVGIIMCKQDNEYVIKYCSDNRIISRQYILV